jgi:hypothetical protein
MTLAQSLRQSTDNLMRLYDKQERLFRRLDGSNSLRLGNDSAGERGAGKG